jgi:hypothetical protein
MRTSPNTPAIVPFICHVLAFQPPNLREGDFPAAFEAAAKRHPLDSTFKISRRTRCGANVDSAVALQAAMKTMYGPV